MKSLVEQLAREVGMWAEWASPFPSSPEEHNARLERFAQLVAAEAVKVAEAFAETTAFEHGAYGAAAAIRERFGIKEG